MAKASMRNSFCIRTETEPNGSSERGAVKPNRRQQGFTLIELIVVIVLFGLVMSVAASRTDQILFWQDEQALRQFLNTWEFLFREAGARREAYRLVIDLDSQSYSVFREVPDTRSVARQVDYLQNMRTKGQQARRDQKEIEKQRMSFSEEMEEEQYRQAESLESLFFSSVYQDPFGNVRLATPLEFPSLAEKTPLKGGIRITDIRVQSELRSSGQVSIRFHPLGGSEFAVIHFKKSDGSDVSAILNPSSGELTLKQGYVDYEWSFQTPS